MRYKMDNMIVDTVLATNSWEEAIHEKLYRSSKGRYYVVVWLSDSQGSGPGKAYEYTKEMAAKWLLANNHEVPEELKEYVVAIIE